MIEKEILIPLSKTKLGLMLLGAVIFLVLGIWFILNPEVYSSEGDRSIFLLKR